MEEINAALDAWAAQTRRPDNRRYVEMLQAGLSRHVSAFTGLQPGMLNAADLGPLAAGLAAYHVSHWRHGTTLSVILDETAGGRKRYTFPAINGFCASANVSLPERRSHTQFLSGFDDAIEFRRRFAAAFFAFDHVLIEDPLPWCLGWQDADWRRQPPDGVVPPDGLVASGLGMAERVRIAAWLQFCRIFADELGSGRIVPVTTIMPNWQFHYLGGSESDHDRIDGFGRIRTNILTQFLIGDDDPTAIAAAQSVGLAPELPDKVVLDLFWQSHFCDSASAACDTPEEARFVARHLFEHRQSLSPGKAVLENFGSAAVLTGFSVDAAHLTFLEIAEIARSEEVVSALRDTIRNCSREAVRTSQAEMSAGLAICQAELERLRSQLLASDGGNDWKSALFKPSLTAGLTFVGGAAGSALGSSDVAAIVGGGLGGVFPLLFTARAAVDDARRRRRARVAMRLLLTYLTPGASRD